jgi:hypothetical protein
MFKIVLLQLPALSRSSPIPTRRLSPPSVMLVKVLRLDQGCLTVNWISTILLVDTTQKYASLLEPDIDTLLIRVNLYLLLVAPFGQRMHRFSHALMN